MRTPIELNYEDLAGLGGPAVAGKELETPGGPPETGQDMLATIDGVIERVNEVITNFKDMLAMIKGAGFSGPPAQSQTQLYKPQLSLAQQLHASVNVLYSAYGDITMTQLLQALYQQYGNSKLSELLKALEAQGK